MTENNTVAILEMNWSALVLSKSNVALVNNILFLPTVDVEARETAAQVARVHTLQAG